MHRVLLLSGDQGTLPVNTARNNALIVKFPETRESGKGETGEIRLKCVRQLHGFHKSDWVSAPGRRERQPVGIAPANGKFNVF